MSTKGSVGRSDFSLCHVRDLMLVVYKNKSTVEERLLHLVYEAGRDIQIFLVLIVDKPFLLPACNRYGCLLPVLVD